MSSISRVVAGLTMAGLLGLTATISGKGMKGATMGTELDYDLPTDPTKYRGNLANQYAAICVTKYQAAALAG